MNAVEIEQAISDLAEREFDAAEFPFAFLEAFGNKATTLKKLRSGSSNKSDLGGVLQTGNIHIKVAEQGQVTENLAALRDSPATLNKRHRVKFILTTDGDTLEAEDLASGETVACAYSDFPDKFGFFLPLAGITTVEQIRENTFDVRATSRLNRLYVTLLQENPDWGTEDRRHDMNHFMARLIFCFFAEDTDIFSGDNLFTATISQMSERDGSNTHEVISEIFRAMDVKIEDRATAGLRNWANTFPYVNGELFSGSTEVPRFSRIAQKYLLHIGNLDWKQINPDIFGSMIQAVADEEERSSLGMHYTSVPNILKVLNPLFLDDLRDKLKDAGDNARKLLNLRKRMSNIRVFDPACGSGNFLVIAYKEMRAIEAEINERRGEPHRETEIPLTNFRGIELRDFSAEIARLALIIAEYQADVVHIGEKEARQAFLPLDEKNWITCGNALRLDWLDICPPTGRAVRVTAEDLFDAPSDQAEIDFENEGGETYICGNPPYLGSKWQSAEQKSELSNACDGIVSSSKSLDYVAGWFVKALQYSLYTPTATAFVTTNSICQGLQVPLLWPEIIRRGQVISFAHTSFKWANLAAHNAGVTVAIVGLATDARSIRRLYSIGEDGQTVVSEVAEISPYLVPGKTTIVQQTRHSISQLHYMDLGNMPKDGGHLLLSPEDAASLKADYPEARKFCFDFVGSQEFVRGIVRQCIWVEDDQVEEASSIDGLAIRFEGVRQMRLASRASSTRDFADKFYKFKQIQGRGLESTIVVPKVTSESRPYLPVGLLSAHSIVSDNAFALYDAPLWNMALIASRIHLVWIATVCGKMKTDFRYSNTLGWNTFPVPKMTEKNRADLTHCAEDILLTREAHFPATIAELYSPEQMPQDLQEAHDRNDAVVESIYMGRRFKNDTERLEKLFDMYTKMTTKVAV